MGFSASGMQDLIFLTVIILVSFVFGILVGRFRLISVLINSYISLAILKAVPQGFLTTYMNSLIFFFAFFIALIIASKKLFEIRIYGSGSGFLWRVFSISFLEIMLLVSIVLTTVPKKVALAYVSKNVYQLVASPNAYFLWLIMPLVGLLLIRKKLSRN
jgi:hypothetical protein